MGEKDSGGRDQVHAKHMPNSTNVSVIVLP